MSDTYTPTPVTADQLRPGDIVLFADGTRWFAAFDVDTHTEHDDVQVWTAVADQEDRGLPSTLYFAPTYRFTVDRRDGGPRTTHTTVDVPAAPGTY